MFIGLTLPLSIRRRSASPVAATDVGGLMPAVGGCLVVTPPVDVEPHAVIAITDAAAMANATSRCNWIPFISPLLSFLFSGRKRDQATRPGERAGPQSPGRGPGRAYSAVLPQVTPRGRAAR